MEENLKNENREVYAKNTTQENASTEKTVFVNLKSAESAENATALSVKSTGDMLLPDHIYTQLPELLKKECLKFQGRERDIFFLSLLTLISGIIGKMYGIYDSRKIHANLYFNLIGNPATGKGVMTFAKHSASQLHAHISNSEEIAAPVENLSVKPKMLFIPANSSNSALMACLKSNGGSGIIFETEADTLSNALRQDWGGFSDLLRKAFHHETVSDNKMSGNGYLEISEPRLSVLISGTPSQLPKMMNSIQDGLFSRFIYYFNPERAVWKNVFENKIHPNYYKKEFGELICQIYSFYETNETEFRLTDEQKGAFNDFFGKKTEALKEVFSTELDASSFRLPVIIYRIAMVLTAIKNFEEEKKDAVLYCDDVVFWTSIKLFDTLYAHTLSVIDLIPTKSDEGLNLTEQIISNAISEGEVVATASIVSKGKEFGVADRTIKDNLKKMLKKGIIKQIAHGKYTK